jgi:protein-S-isoprenylcysteine O-methyltransferase Ste14
MISVNVVGLNIANLLTQTTLRIKSTIPPSSDPDASKGEVVHGVQVPQSVKTLWTIDNTIANITTGILVRYFWLNPKPVNEFPFVRASIVTSSIAIFGGLLRLYAFGKLGHMFSFKIGVKKGARLVTDGIYKYVRHPSYTGLLFLEWANSMNLGLWLWYLHENGVIAESARNVWLLSLFLFKVYGSVWLIVGRVPEEEAMLRLNYGQDYVNYQQRSWRLLPFIY